MASMLRAFAKAVLAVLLVGAAALPNEPGDWGRLSPFLAGSSLVRKLNLAPAKSPDLRGETPSAARRVPLTGGLMMRLFPDEQIGRIFQRHGYQATFVVLHPARHRNNAEYQALLQRLVAMGHDVGFWYDRSPSCIELFHANDLEDFLALERDPEVWDEAAGRPRTDPYGSPMTGIAEVLRIRGAVFLGLNSSIKYQTARDVAVRPVHGTDRIVIENLPEAVLGGSFYIRFEPDEDGVPAAIRGRWVTVGPARPAESPEQPVLMYEAISLKDYAGELFDNPANRALRVRAGLDIDREGDRYTTIKRSVAYNNMPNERARFYTYANAIRAFVAMGLPRPDTVGEPRCLYEKTCPSARPLKQLGYLAGGVDPLHGGHTYFMPDDLRYRIATFGGAASLPGEAAGGRAEFVDTASSARGNGIGFNRNYVDRGEDFDYVGYAFSRVVQAVAKKRFINERQTVAYGDRERRFWDELLRRCRKHNLPVFSQRQAMVHLFDREPLPGSPVPAVDRDLDENGVPDGYAMLAPGTAWARSADAELSPFGGRHFERAAPGELFRIDWMGGVRPGRSQVALWANGTPGDRLRVSVVFKQYHFIDAQRYGQTVTDVVSAREVVLTRAGWHAAAVGAIEKPRDCYFNDVVVELLKAAGPGPVRVSQLLIE